MHLSLSIRTRLFASFLGVALISAAGLSWYFLTQMESIGLRTLEERLGNEALVASAFVAERGLGSPVRLQSALAEANPAVPSRLRVLNGAGVAVADSAGGDGIGIDYSERAEVEEALAGRYGAATRTSDDGVFTMFIAYPVRSGGQIIGAAYASAPTLSVTLLLREYRQQLMWAAGFFLVATLTLAELLSRWLTQPLRHLERGTAAFASGDFGVRVEPIGARETRAVAEAFNTMADQVERVVRELKNEERRKSHFVSDVSHELRTPLTAIRGAAETLLDGEVPPEDAERFLSTIVSESDRLARLANDLLALQRIEGATGELPLRRLDLADVARRAAAALEPLLGERGSTVVVSGDAPPVLGDPDRLQQVVANLLDNATRVSGNTTVRVEVSQEGDCSVLSVLDVGPGIPEQDLGRLFDRFSRTQASRDRSSGGSGLGLAIVKAIVTAHAGEIEAANRPEGGARFTLRLPGLKG
ncbi:MAG: ATP-binding protein [Coriobacteriia bacterium]|jgi:two-component system OmpR family sensor kinase|nr:ATP-binding protein [Coriobacteriia bacterium]